MRFWTAQLWIIGLALVLSGPAAAKKRFAKKTKKECSFCHYNPQGGGARNVNGLYYHAHKKLPPPEATKEEIKALVDAWIEEVGRTPPVIAWRYTPVEALPDTPAPTYKPASDLEVLRRLSLDLRGALPPLDDVNRLAKGETTLEALTDSYLATDDFRRTFKLYHSDLVRPRTGIFNKKASLSPVIEMKAGGGSKVYHSTRLRGEVQQGGCTPSAQVKVSPYWNRTIKVSVCAQTANPAHEVVRDGQTFRCDTEAGQASGYCGCGPHLIYCYRHGDRGRVKRSMLQEGARLAMEVVNNDLPYSTVLTADWTMRNGRLDHFYARLDGTLSELTDPDVETKWRRVQLPSYHAGILSTHSYLNFFYNGRRWAQRTFESFMCNETVPDYDFLDEHGPETPTSYKTHPLAEPDMNVNSGRACAACHVQLDGLSRLKDRWDNFGQFYPERQGQPIPQGGIFQGEPVEGLRGFAEALGRSDVFLDCAVNQAWDHLLGHRFRPEEVSTRKRLLAGFKQSGERFKWLVKAITQTPEYRATKSSKLMKREQYWRSMERLTDVRWNVGKRRGKPVRGFDLFYDKVGGMDYRKIERRDTTPSQGHSLVQFKAAAETCDKAIDRDRKRAANKRRFLRKVRQPDVISSDKAFNSQLNDWYARLYARVELTDSERSAHRTLYETVAKSHSPADGYKAVCTALFASAEFAIY